MNERLEPIQLTTEGPASLDGALSLKVAAEALADLADGLDGTSESLSKGTPAITWTLQSARAGSLVATIQPIALDEFGPAVADETVRRVASAIESGKAGMDLGPLLPPRAAAGVRRLIGRIASGSIASASIERGDIHVRIDQNASGTVAISTPAETFGSVEGELIGVKYGSSPYLIVRSRSTGAEVNCHFTIEEIDTELIRQSLKQRVIVAGIAMVDAVGTMRRLHDCDLLRILPASGTLPTPGDLAGLVPAFTDGQPAEVWASANRA